MCKYKCRKLELKSFSKIVESREPKAQGIEWHVSDLFLLFIRLRGRVGGSRGKQEEG